VGLHRYAGTERSGVGLQNTVAVLENVDVPEPKSTPTALEQRFIPSIMIATAVMLSTVGFDDEVGFHTSKVYHIGRDRMLASEPPAELVLPERIQKQPLRFPRVPTQTASASGDSGTASHLPNPRSWKRKAGAASRSRQVR